VDYINEATEETAAAPEAEAEPAEAAAQPHLHKRTQKDAADAPVSANGDAKTPTEAPATAPIADPNRRETP
jgi:hypothetical protein